jgi:Helix-turn-helix domain
MDETPRLLTLPEAVRQAPVTVSERTLRRAIQRGELEAVLAFGKYRITRESFAKFLNLPGPDFNSALLAAVEPKP